MRWDEVTSDEFARAVRECGGVCIVSLGVLERHGPHLPLGTDVITGQHVAELAARREPAIVFPDWFIGQIYETRCFPGTITLPPALTVEVLLRLLDEIGRNGLTKIILYLAHGGNNFLAPFLAQCQLAAPKPYQVYALYGDAGMTAAQKREWEAIFAHPGGHAGEDETSLMLAARPELVKMAALRGQTAPPLGRVKLGEGRHYAPFQWYGNYPQQYAGDARRASADKGCRLAELMAKAMAAFIRKVKEDKVSPALAAEFFARETALRKKTRRHGDAGTRRRRR